MSNVKPHKGLSKSQFKKLLKKSERVSSFAGPVYNSMHKSVIREIQVQKDNNAKATQKSLHMVINAGTEDVGKLRPEVQDIIDSLKSTAEKIIDPTSEDNDDVIRSMCELASSCISVEYPEEPRAEKILVRGEKAHSRKLYNICFHVKGVLSLVFEWCLLGHIDQASVLALIAMTFNTITALYDLSTIKFTHTHAAVLQEWYRTPKEDGGVDEEKLIAKIIEKRGNAIPDLNRETIMNAVDELVKWHCADVVDGRVIITEYLVIK